MRIHKRPLLLGLLILVLASLHLGAFLLLMPYLSVHADLAMEGFQSPEVEAALARERQFPSSDPLLFLVPRESSIQPLVSALENRGLPVRSILSVWDPQRDPPLSTFLDENPLARRLFLNTAKSHWQVYVPTKNGGQAEVALSRDLPSKFPGVVMGGGPWVRALLDQAMVINMAWLLPGALMVLLLVFGLLTRSPTSALRLMFLSSQPALGVLLFFPVTGMTFNFTTVLAPLLTLALATTYVLHIHHHVQEHGPGWRELLKTRGRAVFWSALISALGFSSLWFSPLSTLRGLGTLLVAGLGLSLFWSMIALPVLAAAWPDRGPHSRLDIPPGQPWVRWIFLAVLVCALPGLSKVSQALHWSDYLSPQSTEGRELSRFEALVPAWQEATLHLGWPEEEGWLKPERWQVLGPMTERWRDEYPMTLWSVYDAVPRVQGGDALAEALEFLPPAQDTGKLIDGRRSELVVRFAAPQGQFPFERIEADAKKNLPGVTVGWSGSLYRQEMGMASFLVGEFWGLVTFFGVTGFLIVIRLRSLRRGMLALAPALGATAVFLGLAGWFHWPIGPATALVAAACIGQSTDDGLLWSLLPPSQEVRRSLAESTLLLTSTLAVLLFSSFVNIAQAAVLVIVSLIFSTSMVLWFLPWRRRS